MTWYSETAAANGDVLAIPFPAETSFPEGGKLVCTAVIDSLAEVSCAINAK